MSDSRFFSPTRTISVREIADMTGSVLAHDDLGDREVTTIAPINDSQVGALVYADRKRALSSLSGPLPAAILCPASLSAAVPAGIAVLECSAPQQAFASVARLLYPQAAKPAPAGGVYGVSDRAVIHPEATVEEGATVEAGAVIGPGAAIGRGSVVACNAVVGPHTQIGRDCHIGAGTTVQYALIGDNVVVHPGARIGQDGFGYVPGKNGFEKIPQIGRVIIQDDVEIGANSTIDRGMMADTVIGEGTKIDNLVQIGHNVRIGRCCAIAGQCGISGSVTIGDFSILGGAVGVGDHVVIGSGAQIAGRSGVPWDVPDGAKIAGYPAIPVRDWLRLNVLLQRFARKRDGGPGDD